MAAGYYKLKEKRKREELLLAKYVKEQEEHGRNKDK